MLAKDDNCMTQQLLNRASLKALLAKPLLKPHYSSFVKPYETLLMPLFSVLVPWLGVPKRSPPSEPDAPRAFNHPKISIPGGERAQMTPSRIQPATLPRAASEAAVCPLSYGRIAHCAGGVSLAVWGAICGGVMRALSPPGVEILG